MHGRRPCVTEQEEGSEEVFSPNRGSWHLLWFCKRSNNSTDLHIMSADLQSPTHRHPRRAWIGIDTSQSPPVAVAAWRSFGRLYRAVVPLEHLAQKRSGGARCSMAVSMESVFTERLEPPARTLEQAERLAAGMLDLRLPLPVEQCAVTWVPADAQRRSTALIAYAIDRKALNSRLAALEGMVAAERLVPAAHALWHWMMLQEPVTGENTLQLLLHAGKHHGTLLAGYGGQLRCCITVPPGDLDAVGRHLQVFATRWSPSSSRMLLCGEAADTALLESLRALPACADTDIRLADDARTCLASALAIEALGLNRGGAHEGDLRASLGGHPVTQRRQRRAQALQAAALLLAGLVLAGAQFARLHKSRRALAMLDQRVVQAANRLAGRPLPVRGAAAIELARRELDTRLHPEVEALGEPRLATHLADLLDAVALRRMTLGTLVVDDRRIELVGLADNEADLSVLREAARRAQLVPAIESMPTPSGRLRFSATLMRQEVLP
jgi:hypothetical protein